jgi:glutamine phosphoribosylpyrophosphate amidotransferase
MLKELESDSLREECGVFGIFNNTDAATITYFGLNALQHRGQEAVHRFSTHCRTYGSRQHNYQMQHTNTNTHTRTRTHTTLVHAHMHTRAQMRAHVGAHECLTAQQSN